jgi:hypothetical protein
MINLNKYPTLNHKIKKKIKNKKETGNIKE